MAKVCIPCGVANTKRVLEGDAVTASLGRCEICGEWESVVSASTYALADEDVAALAQRPTKDVVP